MNELIGLARAWESKSAHEAALAKNRKITPLARRLHRSRAVIYSENAASLRLALNDLSETALTKLSHTTETNGKRQ